MKGELQKCTDYFSVHNTDITLLCLCVSIEKKCEKKKKGTQKEKLEPSVQTPICVTQSIILFQNCRISDTMEIHQYNQYLLSEIPAVDFWKIGGWLL